ncbi:PDC sensor domain-containing protein, partial [Nitrospiraceae bacterium AH_259_D15_M11_P09]|nr:PDC sensor domain-containing protein [Nitrospiraceae bacterium AH_259_D15_M11_P09]
VEKSARGRLRGKALQRLKAYLKSVRGKFSDYEELMVINPKGRVVTTSAAKAGPVNLPPDWLKRARAGNAIIGNAYWDDLLNKVAMKIAVPIKAADGRLLGVLAAKLNFHTIETVMKRLA